MGVYLNSEDPSSEGEGEMVYECPAVVVAGGTECQCQKGNCLQLNLRPSQKDTRLLIV